MSVFHENMLIGASGQGAAGPTAGRSVRFNSADSAYLSRTPASAGNQKTWTWSSWIKRGKEANVILLCNADTAANNGFYLAIYGNKLYTETYTTTSVWNVTTNRLFRDFSAWYHIVVAVDTTQSTASDRVKIYVNGVQETSFSTSNYPSQNYDTLLNNTTFHAIGRAGQNSASNFDGYMALVHLIDGQALTPSSFGETSATTGQWIAKTYSGSYGTNGFFLDFLDNSTAAALGYDAAGSNDWTVNNIIVGPTATTNDSWSGYFDGNGDYLTLSSNASMSFGTGTFTIEGWFLTTDKSLSVGAGRTLIGNSGNSYTSQLYITTNGYITFGNTGSTFLQGSTNLADASWHHVAVSRSGTGSNQIAMWVDGTRVALGTNAENYTSGTIYIGAFDTANGYWNGYISNLRIVKGSSVYDPSNSTITVPTSPLTAITNTALLICKSSTFVDNSANAYTVTANGNARVSRDGPFEIFSDSDSLRDHPTSAGTSTGLGGEVSGNYATWNPLSDLANGATFANGNLEVTTISSGEQSIPSTLFVSSGKWYGEITVTTSSTCSVGLIPPSYLTGQQPGITADSYGYRNNGTKITNGSVTSYGASFTNGDVIGIALDLTGGTITFYKNGSSQGTAFTSVSGTLCLAFGDLASSASTSCIANFGQRAFAYTAPSGFSPLVDTLLPTPTIAKPNTVMDVVTYTGSGASKTITLPGAFNPDLVWIKARSIGYAHALFDVIRGGRKILISNSTAAEDDLTAYSSGITSFNSDGFTLDSDGAGYTNESTRTYVGWCWDAGSSNATNTSGSITSTVRANISAGFSVISYAATGSNGTVGHGLGVAPAFIIGKNRSSTSFWRVYHSSIAATKVLFLNDTSGETTDIAFNSTAPTSSVISVNGSEVLNSSGNVILYAWTPVAGYSAFGSYTGNGSSDGPFVYTGFRPAYVLIKGSSSVTSWNIVDKQRLGYNADNYRLFAESSSAENATGILDFTANGFKIRNTGGDYNDNAQTYVYACFAESPLPYARAR